VLTQSPPVCELKKPRRKGGEKGEIYVGAANKVSPGGGRKRGGTCALFLGGEGSDVKGGENNGDSKDKRKEKKDENKKRGKGRMKSLRNLSQHRHRSEEDSKGGGGGNCLSGGFLKSSGKEKAKKKNTQKRATD